MASEGEKEGAGEVEVLRRVENSFVAFWREKQGKEGLVVGGRLVSPPIMSKL